MNVFRKILVVGLLGVGGCATNQDTGSGAATALKGLAIDGALAAAQVYVDTNNNNKLDDWEPHALTDDKGYFSKSATGVDYCRDGAPLSDSIHCLKTTSSDSMALLRFVGGYDLTTSTKFVGTIAANVAVSSASSGNGIVSNPVTTLLSYMTAAQRAAFVTNESSAAGVTLSESILATDYTALTGNATTEQRWVAKLAMEIHKVTDVIEAGLIKNSIADARTKVYKAMAATNYGTSDFGAYLIAGSNIATLVNAAAGVSTAAWTTPSATEITNRAKEVALLAEDEFVNNTASPAIDAVGLAGRMRAIEILTAGLRDFTTNPGATAVPNAARKAASTVGAGGNADFATYITNVGTDASFVFALVSKTFFPTVTYANAASAVFTPVSVTSLAPGGSLDNTKLAISGGADAASVSFGANNTLTLDLNVAGGSGSSLGGANTITGTYQTLPDGTLVMNLEPVPGVIVPALVNVTVDPANPANYQYSIDFNGTTSTFSVPSGGTNGFCGATTTTTTAGTC